MHLKRNRYCNMARLTMEFSQLPRYSTHPFFFQMWSSLKYLYSERYIAPLYGSHIPGQSWKGGFSSIVLIEPPSWVSGYPSLSTGENPAVFGELSPVCQLLLGESSGLDSTHVFFLSTEQLPCVHVYVHIWLSLVLSLTSCHYSHHKLWWIPVLKSIFSTFVFTFTSAKHLGETNFSHRM